MRDPVRIAFALLSPMLLMFAFGYGISFDVEHLRFAVSTKPSPESRSFSRLRRSRFGADSPILPRPIRSRPVCAAAAEIRDRNPPLFGSDLLSAAQIAIWISGDMPNRARPRAPIWAD
jgi:ribosome-dependent ATPase